MNAKETKEIKKLHDITKEIEQADESFAKIKDKALRRTIQKQKSIRYNLRGVI